MVILAAAGGVTYLEIQPSSSSTPLQTTAVRQGTVLATVSSSGTLEAAQDLGLNFTTGGKLTHIYVKVGQRVKAGQLLAAVDPTSSQQALTQAETQLTAAEAQLASAEAAETPTQKKLQKDSVSSSAQSVTSAKQNLASAQTSYADDQTSTDQSITTAEDNLNAAEQNPVPGRVEGDHRRADAEHRSGGGTDRVRCHRNSHLHRHRDRYPGQHNLRLVLGGPVDR